MHYAFLIYSLSLFDDLFWLICSIQWRYRYGSQGADSALSLWPEVNILLSFYRVIIAIVFFISRDLDVVVFILLAGEKIGVRGVFLAHLRLQSDLLKQWGKVFLLYVIRCTRRSFTHHADWCFAIVWKDLSHVVLTVLYAILDELEVLVIGHVCSYV